MRAPKSVPRATDRATETAPGRYGRVHSTAHARLALVCLIGLLGTVVLARLGEARFRARPAPSVQATRGAARAASGPTHEGNALRDGKTIDPNFASALELELLPGIGPALSREIVARRLQRGAFRTLDELRQVRGIGSKTLAKIAPYLRIDSERLEHPAQAQRDVGRTQQVMVVEQQRAAHVEAHDPAP